MANLKGSPELQARLKAVRLCFKPIGRKWAETGVSLAPPMVPTRPASMWAGDKHQPGRLHSSFKVKTATQRKAVIGAHYTAYFIDAGVKPHSMQKRSKGQDRTVFAKKHPGYKARPFRARMAHEALRQNPMAETLIAEWNRVA